MYTLEELPRNKIIDIFGYPTPNKRELEAYSDLLWKSSLPHRRNIKRTVIRTRVHMFMKDLGYYQLLDFQIRDRQIRFTEASVLSMAIVAGLDELLDAPIDSDILTYWT